ncbi:MAG: glycerol-3-phosphate dehydrogenase/oxidase [Pseudomonadales bacterium]|nr:glycerol-3-phosphate dehydrogenase/oxidase [Pseudomonadales bacterium]
MIGGVNLRLASIHYAAMKLRNSNVRRLGNEEYDVLIVGGGINGAVSAAALAAKGVKVALIDRGDFAGSTSSESSNLAWGGIKYLESYEFLLVNKLCKSRNYLMDHYPSTVKEIRFLTSIAKGFRYPAFLVYLSTLLYWVIGRFKTGIPKYRSRARLNSLEPAINTSDVQAGFEYSDCYLYDNDARFVFNFIRTALDNDCVAANYVESLGSERNGDIWTTSVQDKVCGESFDIRSRVLINACGPWLDDHNGLTKQKTEYHHLFSKGVHLIVDRVAEAERVLAFFASDGRLFFVIPMGPKTCIGTTDTQVDSPEQVVSDSERAFILENANNMLRLERPLTKQDIVAERCGVRPLAHEGAGGVADWVGLSRKHVIEVRDQDAHLSVFGGKLTDCLNVGNEIADIVKNLDIDVPFANRKWYGEPDDTVKEAFLHQAKLMDLDDLTSPSSSEPLTTRLWRRYGSNAFEILEGIREEPQRAELLIENAEYLRGEIELASRREMIVKLEDFLRRRSKISLVVRDEDLRTAEGLKEACQILFGNEAEEKLREYLLESETATV